MVNELEKIKLLQLRANFDVFEYVTKKGLEFFDLIDVEELTDLLKAKIGMELIDRGTIFNFVDKFSVQQAILSAKLKIENEEKKRRLNKRIKGENNG